MAGFLKYGFVDNRVDKMDERLSWRLSIAFSFFKLDQLSKPMKRSSDTVRVAIIGGGCASMAAAFELSRPEHQGKYQLTVYQLGWRLGGKGASGRGISDRIEEHGVHVWYGSYENAFGLLRESYAELARDPLTNRFANWQDAFTPSGHLGVVDTMLDGKRQPWIPTLPERPGGLPGDPSNSSRRFEIQDYLVQSVDLLRTLLRSTREGDGRSSSSSKASRDPVGLVSELMDLLNYTGLATIEGLIDAAEMLTTLFKNVRLVPESLLSNAVSAVQESIRSWFDAWIDTSDERRRMWELADLILAFLVGSRAPPAGSRSQWF